MASTLAYFDVEQHACLCYRVCIREAPGSTGDVRKPSYPAGKNRTQPTLAEKEMNASAKPIHLFGLHIPGIMKTPFRTAMLIPASPLSKIKLSPNICSKSLQVNTSLSSPVYRPWAASVSPEASTYSPRYLLVSQSFYFHVELSFGTAGKARLKKTTIFQTCC